MGARGFRVFKKLRKLKMKTRQYDTDEAGDYGDAVPLLLEILHNSGFGYKVKMAAPVFTEKCRVKEYNKQVGTWPSWQLQRLQRNAESKNTTNKWGTWILFYFNHGCLRAKEGNRLKLVLNT